MSDVPFSNSVFIWMVLGWIVGSCVGVYLVGFPGYYTGEADMGAAFLGLLCGWGVGMIHGTVALWLRRRRAT